MQWSHVRLRLSTKISTKTAPEAPLPRIIRSLVALGIRESVSNGGVHSSGQRATQAIVEGSEVPAEVAAVTTHGFGPDTPEVFQSALLKTSSTFWAT